MLARPPREVVQIVVEKGAIEVHGATGEFDMLVHQLAFAASATSAEEAEQPDGSQAVAHLPTQENAAEAQGHAGCLL